MTARVRVDDVITWSGPESVVVRGVLTIVPGRGESPRIYERFGRRLASDAYLTHAVTAPTESAERTFAQLETIADAAGPDVPFVVVGSDTGAAYAARLVADGALSRVSALVLAGLPTGAAATPAEDWAGELDIRTSCPTHRAHLSSVGLRSAELFGDVPAEWVDPAVPPRLDIPVLGVHGRDDAVSDVEAARRWYASVPRAEMITVAGGRHDILNDQTHRTVAASVVLFLERLRGGAELAPIAFLEAVRAA